MLEHPHHCPGKKVIHYCCIFLLTSFFFVSLLSSAGGTASSPKNYVAEIIPWYGTEQKFGSPGLAQHWINILGHVDSQVPATRISYSLNNGPEQQLSIGPDSRRLSLPGDFNIDLDAEKLLHGTNIVRLSAQTEDNTEIQLDITLGYNPKKWPLPYAVDWQRVVNIQETVQVVDGLWQQTEHGLRTAPDRIGYDRSFAIGDSDWTSYEVLLPLTVHGVDTRAFSSPESVSPGFGIIMHWQGHTDTPINCGQPHCGWYPFGAQSWYFFKDDKPGVMNIITDPLPLQPIAVPYKIIPGTTYMLRARVDKKSFRTLYSMKLWQQEEPEPEKWSLVRSADAKNLNSGGLLVVAHHIDMTVGNMNVYPVSAEQPQNTGWTENFWFKLREYLVPMPLILVFIAGAWIIRRKPRQAKIFSQKISRVAMLSVTGLLLVLLAEPFFPAILIHYSLNAKMTAALYLGLNIGRILFQAVIWLMFLLLLVQKEADK